MNRRVQMGKVIGRLLVVSVLFFTISNELSSQTVTNADSLEAIKYTRQKEYIIEEVKVKGVEFLNPNHLVSISGLSRGQKIKIPGAETSKAIKKYWKYGLFSDVKIVLAKTEGNKAFIEIHLTEQPRLNDIKLIGIKKGDQEDLIEKIGLRRGSQVTNNSLNSASTIIKRHYIEKGFLNVDVNIRQKPVKEKKNQVDVAIHIEKKNKVKIENIFFEGNDSFDDDKLRRQFKKTKQRSINFFKSKKYIAEDYKEDKIMLIDFYNENGYRDAQIINEEIIPVSEKRVHLKITLFEGAQYYLRSISWIGNTKYPSTYLTTVLGAKVGEVYDKKTLGDRLNIDEDAVSSLYTDDGYLFFTATPVETVVENDSVDIEIRIFEGPQATLNNITISGNDKTNEHVVRRELYTRPGELFSRSDIIRSVRQIATLGHFNPETVNPNIVPNQADGTVDIEYQLEERSNDQLELSGGWGGYYGFVGSIGLRFANFSAGRAFEKGAWRPVPSGDGQTLSLRAQSNRTYHSFNISFMEPWLGGKKPNSFTVSTNYTIMKNSQYRNPYYNDDDFDASGRFEIIGGSIGFGKRLKWPDDYFSIYTELGYQRYFINKYQSYFTLPDGKYNLLSAKVVLSRNSQDQMIFPRRGSAFNLGVQFTPPYSMWNGADYDSDEYKGVENLNKKFKQIEFHKWTFDAAWFTNIFADLVLATKAEFGYLAAYNNDLGPPPFEKFSVGGSGLSGYNMFGTDVVPLRGYPDGDVTPIEQQYYNNGTPATTAENGNIYTRYYAELRYPLSQNPNAYVYLLSFAEAGNAWSSFNKFNPYAVKRSAGFGVRAFLPMFGLLGIDWGYGFDDLPGTTYRYNRARGPEWHFIIGQQL